MQDKTKEQDTGSRNEGEGNKTAAREYNKAQRRFVESGKVEEKAREAEKSLDTEKRQLERAEAVGKRHKAAEDPEITRKVLTASPTLSGGTRIARSRRRLAPINPSTKSRLPGVSRRPPRVEPRTDPESFLTQGFRLVCRSD